MLINEVNGFAAALYPDLRRHAECELRRLGLDSLAAQDLVQEAWLGWLKTQPERIEAWLRIRIRGLAIDQVRRPRDPLDMEPLSVDELQL